MLSAGTCPHPLLPSLSQSPCCGGLRLRQQKGSEAEVKTAMDQNKGVDVQEKQIGGTEGSKTIGADAFAKVTAALRGGGGGESQSHSSVEKVPDLFIDSFFKNIFLR